MELLKNISQLSRQEKSLLFNLTVQSGRCRSELISYLNENYPNASQSIIDGSLIDISVLPDHEIVAHALKDHFIKIDIEQIKKHLIPKKNGSLCSIYVPSLTNIQVVLNSSKLDRKFTKIVRAYRAREKLAFFFLNLDQLETIPLISSDNDVVSIERASNLKDCITKLWSHKSSLIGIIVSVIQVATKRSINSHNLNEICTAVAFSSMYNNNK